MNEFDSRIRLGFSAAMLFPRAFDDPLAHFEALSLSCRFPHYETIETFLPENSSLRAACVRVLRENKKALHYNPPAPFQQDGPYNPGSDDAASRRRALELMKKNIDYAAEAESPLMVLTACPDKGPEKREEILKRFEDFFLKTAEYAARYGIEVTLEPIERHRFKKLVLGPTAECARFIMDVKGKGATNVNLMLDIGHAPLMEESVDEMFEGAKISGFTHVHLGNAVLDPESEYYGHMHAPLGMQGGMFDTPELTEQFGRLFECGYLPKTPGVRRATVSLEVRPYLGCSEAASIELMYEKIKYACDCAAAKLNIY